MWVLINSCFSLRYEEREEIVTSLLLLLLEGETGWEHCRSASGSFVAAIVLR